MAKSGRLVYVLVAVLIAYTSAEPARRKSAKQEAVAPYPPSGFRPETPFILPTEDVTTTPGPTYLPPAEVATPGPTYLPPSEEITTPSLEYGPPEEVTTPAQEYGPPAAPDAAESPARSLELPSEEYGPPFATESPEPRKFERLVQKSAKQLSAPYPPAGVRPVVPFELPTEEVTTPAQPEEVSTPAQEYGPPAEPEEITTPSQEYGPPAQPEEVSTPSQEYGPPETTALPPSDTYGPPMDAYGPPIVERLILVQRPKIAKLRIAPIFVRKSARQEELPSAPYPPAGIRPETPFVLPTEEVSTPAQEYGAPPAEPSQEYGPPPPAVEVTIYPSQEYGAPAVAELSQRLIFSHHRRPSARQEAAPSAPYPPSGFQPEVPFVLPTEEEVATPTQEYGPPPAVGPSDAYGPPLTTPEEPLSERIVFRSRSRPSKANLRYRTYVVPSVRSSERIIVRPIAARPASFSHSARYQNW